MLDVGYRGLWGALSVRHRAEQHGAVQCSCPMELLGEGCGQSLCKWPPLGMARALSRVLSLQKSRARQAAMQSLTACLNPTLLLTAVRNRGESSFKWPWENNLASAIKWSGEKEEMGVGPWPGGGEGEAGRCM